MERTELQARALLLMYKLGEVAPKTQKIALYDYKGDKVGEQEIHRLKSTGADVKLSSKYKRKRIPQMEIRQGFD